MTQPTTAVTTATAKKTIFDLIQSQKEQVALALPKHMSPDRILRVMMTSLRMTPKLQLCSAESLLGCLMKCSQYGLEPDGRHAHLIPYGDTAQLIFDYKGLVALVRRSGEVSDIHCDVVCENDEFEFSYGMDAKFMHKPNIRSDRGEVYAAYSFVRLKDGTPSYEVMTIDQINEIRDQSQGYKAAKKYNKESVWDLFPDEMAKKTVFRRHSKWLPLSFEVKEAVHADDDKISDDRRFAAAKPIFSNIAQLPAPETVIEQPAQEEPQTQTGTPSQEKTTESPAEKQTPPAETDPVKMVEADHAKLVSLLKAANISDDQFMLYVRISAYVSPIASIDEMKNSPKKLAWLVKNWELKKYAAIIVAAKEAA